jgi:cardiolipin synthase
MEILIHLEGPLRALTRRTEVRLWVDGREAFPRLEKLLRRARHTIIIQMYIWKDDRVGRWFAGILLDAADRGVHIDVTKEAVGDVFEFRDFLTTQASMEPLWRHFWNHPNIRITHVTRNDHTKVFVIDDQILLLTGMNIADEYEESWHDYMVELRGHRFVAQYLMEGAPQPGKVQLILNTQRVRQVRGAVMHLLSSAQRSILIEQCYFSDPKVVDLLIRRSHEGVRITLIVPEAQDLHYHANMQAIGRLLVGSSPGCVQVLLYPGIVHGKVILADRTRMFLGSANLMASSLDEQGEACVLVDGYRIALGKLREVLRGDILKGRPLVSPPQFRWLGRWLAWIGL